VTVSDSIDAYLRAAVACQQCQGTGTYTEAENGCPTDYVPCPGPHTQITIRYRNNPPDFHDQIPETLYADPNRIGEWWTDFPYLTDISEGIILPFPPGWTPA